MKIIDRQINSKVIKSENEYLNSIASINSNGQISIRNYTINGDGKSDGTCDEILLLSVEESNAIEQLFKKLYNNNYLPF